MTQIMRPFIADCKSRNWQAQKETTAPFSSREANCRVFHKKRHIQSHLTADWNQAKPPTIRHSKASTLRLVM